VLDRSDFRGFPPTCRTYDLTSDFYLHAQHSHTVTTSYNMSIAQASKGDLAYQVRSLVRTMTSTFPILIRCNASAATRMHRRLERTFYMPLPPAHHADSSETNMHWLTSTCSTAPSSAKAVSSPPTISASTPNGERAMRFGIAGVQLRSRRYRIWFRRGFGNCRC
jgi:hypothetical protein